MGKFISTKVIELGSTAFRQPKAESHCRFVHGYQLKAKIWFGCDELDSNNWVFDFGGLKELKEKLQKQFDHKLVIDKNDPAKPAFKELERYGAVDLVMMDGVGIEKFAEYVAREADVFVKYKSNNRVWVERVEVFEHENNSAMYLNQIIKEKILEPVPIPVPANLIAKNSEVIPTPVNLEDLVTPSVTYNGQKEPPPAPVGNSVTKGWSNPFGGTSWGV